MYFNGNFSSASVFPRFTEGRDRLHWWPGISLAKPDSSLSPSEKRWMHACTLEGLEINYQVIRLNSVKVMTRRQISH